MLSDHQAASESFRIFVQRVRSLKIHSLLFQLQHSEASAHWTEAQTVKTISHYFAFLYLSDRYPNLVLIPTGNIQHIWRCHAADAEKYATDCQMLFGRIHHCSPFNHSKDDRQDLFVASMLTQVLFRKHFDCSMTTTLAAFVDYPAVSANGNRQPL